MKGKKRSKKVKKGQKRSKNMKYTKKQNKLIIKISLRSSDDGEKTTWLPSGTTNFTRNNGHVVLAVSQVSFPFNINPNFLK